MDFEREMIQLFQVKIDDQLSKYSTNYKKILNGNLQVQDSSMLSNKENELHQDNSRKNNNEIKQKEMQNPESKIIKNRNHPPINIQEVRITKTSDQEIIHRFVDIVNERITKYEFNESKIKMPSIPNDSFIVNNTFIPDLETPLNEKKNKKNKESTQRTQKEIKEEVVALISSKCKEEPLKIQEDIRKDLDSPTNEKSELRENDDITIIDQSKLMSTFLIQPNGQYEYRRRARRGKIGGSNKRKYIAPKEFPEIIKRVKLEHIPLKKTKTTKTNIKKHYKKFQDDLRRNHEEEIQRIRKEGIEASSRIVEELSKLKAYKEGLSEEIKKIERERLRVQNEKDDLNKERIRIETKKKEDLLDLESKRKEIELRLLEEERRKIEEFRRMEEAKNKKHEEEFERMKIEKETLERRLLEETRKIKDERLKIEKERERIDQTFLEIANMTKMHEKSEMEEKSLPSDEVKIVIPKLANPFLYKKNLKIKDLNETFLDVKKEFKENNKTRPPKKEMALNIDKIKPQQLYKSIIDSQSGNDPKKYIPKIQIPVYTNEDEFDSKDKKFEAASFTKDPKLNFIVKGQDNERIKSFFGNLTEIDVEHIFSNIENVTNQSPNKITYSKKE